MFALSPNLFCAVYSVIQSNTADIYTANQNQRVHSTVRINLDVPFRKKRVRV